MGDNEFTFGCLYGGAIGTFLFTLGRQSVARGGDIASLARNLIFDAAAIGLLTGLFLSVFVVSRTMKTPQIATVPIAQRGQRGPDGIP